MPYRIIIFIFTLIFVIPSFAADNTKYFSMRNFSTNYSLGLLSTTSHEYVYKQHSSNNKLSQLNWKVNNAPILKLLVSYDIPKIFSLGFSSWTTTSEKYGKMDDYDWLDESTTSWTNWSHHKQTKLVDALELDSYLIKAIYRSDILNISPVIGYHMNYFDYSAKGGTLSYYNQVTTIPDHYTVITYNQFFYTPYFGLDSSINYKGFVLHGNFKYGYKVKAQDEDFHVLRNTLFTTRSNKPHYLYGALVASYKLYNKVNLYSDLTYSKYSVARGSMSIADMDSFFHSKAKNIAGFDNQSLTISMGFAINI